jgi:hypothetical protein
MPLWLGLPPGHKMQGQTETAPDVSSAYGSCAFESGGSVTEDFSRLRGDKRDSLRCPVVAGGGWDVIVDIDMRDTWRR